MIWANQIVQFFSINIFIIEDLVKWIDVLNHNRIYGVTIRRVLSIRTLKSGRKFMKVNKKFLFVYLF